MEKIKFPTNVKVMICAGGSDIWHHPTIKAGGDGIYLYSNNRLEKQADWNSETGKANMGDPGTLETFLRYGEENFDAKRRIIIFQNHGGLSGICYDETFEPGKMHFLSYDALKSTFAAVYGDSPEELLFELVGFNACMTGSYELANSIADFSHYMAGSEPSSNPVGYDIKSLFSALANDLSMSGEQLAKVLCDNSMKRLEAVDKENGFNLKAVNAFAVIDLTKMPELRAAYKEYFKEALSRSKREMGFSGAFARAAESRKADRYSNLYTDLGLLAENTKSIMPATSNKLLMAIDKAVVYNKHGAYLKSRGISTYYPYISTKEKPEDAVQSTNDAFNMIDGMNSNYSAQKKLYGDLLKLQAPVNANGKTEPISLEKNSRGHFFAKLTPEQLEKFSAVRCVLVPVKKGDSSSYGLDFGGAILTSADDLKIDWKSGTVTENFSVMEPVFDGHKIAMLPSVSGRGHTFYKVPVIYNELRRDLLVRYDTSTKKYSIVGFGTMIENGMVRLTTDKPQPGHVITPLYLILSDNATEEPMGIKMDEGTGQPVTTVIVNEETGEQEQVYVYASSIFSTNTDSMTGKPYYTKFTKGTPFVYTRDSAITSRPITRGAYYYAFGFATPGGYGTVSEPGLIIVEYGEVAKFTQEELLLLAKIAQEISQ